MNVVIITTKTVFHRYLCVEIAKHHNVVAVLYPIGNEEETFSERLKKKWKHLKNYGFWHVLLQKLASNRFDITVGWNIRQDMENAEKKYFANVDDTYSRLIPPIEHNVKDINSPEGVNLLKSFEPDVVICSGGPIYRKQVIEVCDRIYNYHTGISPLYNGAKTRFWTFANRQPELTGGTLMKMDAIVDGGDILAHFLPEIEDSDTPASLFMKSIIGGARLYNNLLDHLSKEGTTVSLPQGRSFNYYYNYQWSSYQTWAIERFLEKGICSRRARPERIWEYWRMPNYDLAKRELEKRLLSLVYNPE